MRLFRLSRRKTPRSTAPSTHSTALSAPASPSIAATNTFSFDRQLADRTKAQMYSIHEQADDVAAAPPPHARRRTSPSPPSRPHSSKDERPRSAGLLNLRRPTLADILADRAPAPWSLAAFTRYAAQNLADESIEFIAEAGKYNDLYASVHDDAHSTTEEQGDDEGKEGGGDYDDVDRATAEQRLRDAFQRIILTYIAPSSPREVNIPGDIRTSLLILQRADAAPSPEALKPAISKVKELIEDSILFSFLTEVRPPSDGSPTPSPAPAVSHLRERTSSSRVAVNHSKRFSASVLEPAISFSSATFRKQRPSEHASSPTSNPGSAAGHNISTISSLFQSQSERSQRSSYTRNLGSMSSSASISSAGGANASILEPALTDDSGISIRSPVGSESFKSPPASDFSTTPPDTPNLHTSRGDMGEGRSGGSNSTTPTIQPASWRRVGAKLSQGLGVSSLRKKRSESADGRRSLGGDESRPRVPVGHKNSTGSEVLFEEDE